VDGNLLPPNIINKLNIFMVNVLRFKGNADLSALIDQAGSHNPRAGETVPENPVAGIPGESPEEKENRRELAMAAVGEGDSDTGCEGCN
ncbi:MAG: hypothetical protein LBG08_03360, partial [Spirochaetaceae bacterium]|jgi:hypothetical protein|nr:hypothetical protein [Spirochaetaceae bacterium]